MQKLFIIRGIVGAGKTDFAHKVMKNIPGRWQHMEIDMYFERDGVYKFNDRMLREYSMLCYQDTKAAIDSGLDVVVSNCFYKRKYFEPYTLLAQRRGIFCPVYTMKKVYGNPHDHTAEFQENIIANWED